MFLGHFAIGLALVWNKWSGTFQHIDLFSKALGLVLMGPTLTGQLLQLKGGHGDFDFKF